MMNFHLKNYDPLATMLVTFIGEDLVKEEAVDCGGPTRELLQLLMTAVQHRPVFAGPPCLDCIGWHWNEYQAAGRLIAVSLAHGGPAPHFFSKMLFHQVMSESPTLAIEDCYDDNVKALLLNVS